MVLNLLQTHTLDEAQELVERSFGQYLSTLYLQPQQAELDRLQTELAVLEESLAAGGNVSTLEKSSPITKNCREDSKKTNVC